jgi:CheY-like chemotaxis protein
MYCMHSFIHRFFFTLPSYKSISVASEGESKAAMTSAVEQHSSPPNALSVATRWAQVSPEAAVKEEDARVDVPVSKFSGIKSRHLSDPSVCKVLLVDDSRVNVNIIKKMLKRVTATWLPPSSTRVTCDDASRRTDGQQNGMGNDNKVLEEDPTPKSVRFDYSEADDGRVAVQMVQAARDAGLPFDVVFMDNIMITMHGPEAAQAMRAAGFAGLIIGVTGNVMVEDINQYMASGADYVLGKPVNMEDLKQILDRLESVAT